MARSMVFFSNAKDAQATKSHATYLTAQTAASATAVASIATTMRLGQQLYNSLYYVFRDGLYFDTSALPDLATITGATLSLYGYLNEGEGGAPDTDFDVTIVSGADLGASGMALADYGDLLNDTTSMGSINTSSWSTSGYNDITLNATGLAVISKTGITQFGLRSSLDISATAPTGRDCVWSFTYEAGIGKQPRLTVFYNLMVPGNIAVIETNLHYIDEYGTERYLTGTVVS